MATCAGRAFVALLVGFGLAGLPSSRAALAQQAFPTRPIEIVVPFAPGGSIDITFRSIAPSLSKRLGQQVLIVNKPGGGGSIGMNLVAKAAPDGYTLGAASFSFAANPAVLGKVPYDPIKDFEPVTMVSRSAMLLLVHPSSPAQTVEAFVAWVRSKPGELNFTSVGVASSGHMMAELFLSKTGLKMTHVPFTANAFAPLAQNQVQFLIGPIPSAMSWIKDGRLRALAVTSAEPDPSVPDVPPVGRTLRGFEVFEWPSIVAPARTPRAVVDRIQHEVAQVVTEPDIVKRLASLGARPVAGTPDQLRPFLQEQIKVWAEVARNLSVQREMK